MGIRSECWLLKPLTCPRPIRYCPTCGIAKEFVCSERFRVNAQKKVLDVWLHYRCSECSGAWKYPVLERHSVAALDAATYEAYVRHDVEMVWKHAFDVGRMRAHVMHVDANVNVAVERRSIEGDADSEKLCIHFAVPFTCDVRLDRLLASELRVSRTAVQRWYERGELQVWPEQERVLSKSARTGQRVLLAAVTKWRDSV